jgi:hypothetical protein
VLDGVKQLGILFYKNRKFEIYNLRLLNVGVEDYMLSFAAK